MALNLRTASLYTNPSSSSSSSFPFLASKLKPLSKYSSSSSLKTYADSDKTQSGLTDQETRAFSGPSTSARAQLDLLEQLSSTSSSRSSDDAKFNPPGYESDGGGSWRLTIRDQLARLVGGREGDFVIPLGQKNLKKMSAKFLTISQKRNIKRQTYLNEVSKRNDSVFFATIGAFVILPPIVILGIAIFNGYVQLFP